MPIKTTARLFAVRSMSVYSWLNCDSKLPKRCVMFAVIALAWGGLLSESRATTLLFDQSRDATGVIPTVSGQGVQQDYGDRVTGSPMNVAGGQFTYGNDGEGFTPNVVVDYSTMAGAGPSTWGIQYGDLTNVIFGGQGSLAMLLLLTADPGFEVLLYHFDLGGWANTDYVIDGVRVLDPVSAVFSQTNVLVQGDFSGARHTSFDFVMPLRAAQLLIEIDYSNLAEGQQDNIGIDNIRFGQDPPATPVSPIPEPSTALLLACGLAVVAVWRRWSTQ